ncbi:hypothetical protein HDU81_006478 [Chytriomyces hyalinus]|nr:hypothetical protein HDU81_006465 [Chytriomyces hyalinus]KAJ3239147.1 hypothetical protein HDU81_006478 [Chytriomyces hyalinus]
MLQGMPPPATAPQDYNATFSKHERAEFSYKLLQLVRLNTKFRNAVSQLAAAAHDLSGGFKDLKRGRVKDGVLAHAQSIDTISDAYLAFAQTLSAVGPKAIQTFEGPIQGIANSYVSSYSNLDRECHTRMTCLTKHQKRVEKELASPWPWKRISGSYSEQQLTRDLSAVLAEKDQLSKFYVSRVYAQDVDTIAAVNALGCANLEILKDALGGWTTCQLNGLKDRVVVGCEAVAMLRSPTLPTNLSQFTSPLQAVSPHLYPAMTHNQSSHSQGGSSQEGMGARSSTMPRLGTASREAAASTSKEVAHPSPKSFHSAEFSPRQTRTELNDRFNASNLSSSFAKESVTQNAKAGGTVTPMSMGGQAEKPTYDQPTIAHNGVFEDVNTRKIDENKFENKIGNRGIQEDSVQANGLSLLPVVHSSPQISDDVDIHAPPNSRTSENSQDTLQNSVSTEHLRSLVSVENASRAAAMLASSATLPHPKAPSSSSSSKMGLKSALRSSGFDSFPRSASTTGTKYASTPVLSQDVATMKDRSYTVGGSGPHMDTSEEPQNFGRVRRKSVHFTNPHGPMVEFWDGSTGHAEEVMSISNASLSGDEQETAAQEKVQQPSKPPALLRQRPMDIDTMRSLYPDMFITESRRLSSTPVQYVENTFFSENEAQRRVGPPVFFPPQADVQSEAGSVVGQVEMGASQHMAGRVLFIAIYKHVPKETKEMAMEKGDVLEIAKRSGKWVLATKVAASQAPADRGPSRGTESGWVPAAFVMKYSLQ